MPCPSAQAQHRHSSSILGIQTGCIAPAKADTGLGGRSSCTAGQLLKTARQSLCPACPGRSPAAGSTDAFKIARVAGCTTGCRCLALPALHCPAIQPLLTELIDRAMLAETSRIAAPDD